MMKLRALATLCALTVCGPASADLVEQTFDFRYPSIMDFGTNQGYVMTADNGLEVSITSTLDGVPTKFNRDPDGGGPVVVNTKLDWSQPDTTLRSAFTTGAASGFAFPTQVNLVSMELVAFAGTCGFSAGAQIDAGSTVLLPYSVNGADPDPGDSNYCRENPEQNVLQTRKSVTFDFQDPNTGLGPIINSGLLLSGNAFSIASLTVKGEASKFPPSVVPLPAAAWLFGSALLGGVGLGYRNRKQSAA